MYILSHVPISIIVLHNPIGLKINSQLRLNVLKSHRKGIIFLPRLKFDVIAMEHPMIIPLLISSPIFHQTKCDIVVSAWLEIQTLYLYGHPSLNFKDNNLILLSLIKFIDAIDLSNIFSPSHPVFII